MVVIDTGEENHREVPSLGTPCLEHVDSFEARHELVEDGEVEGFVSSELQCFRPIGGFNDLVTVCLEVSFHKQPNGWRIICNENSWHPSILAVRPNRPL